MKKIIETLKIIVSWVLFIGIFIGAIYLYNVISPNQYTSNLATGYWGGYYGTPTGGRVWLIAKFNTINKTMRMISSDNNIYNFSYTIDSPNEDFVYYSFEEKNKEFSITAKQLYLGRRYILQKFIAGDFRGFWKRNTNDDIKGEIKGSFGESILEIERLSKDEAAQFYTTFKPASLFTDLENQFTDGPINDIATNTAPFVKY